MTRIPFYQRFLQATTVAVALLGLSVGVADANSEQLPPETQILRVGQLFSLIIQPVHQPGTPDKDIPTIAARDLPPSAVLLKNLDGSRTLMWIPEEHDIGQRVVRLRYIDQSEPEPVREKKLLLKIANLEDYSRLRQEQIAKDFAASSTAEKKPPMPVQGDRNGQVTPVGNSTDISGPDVTESRVADTEMVESGTVESEIADTGIVESEAADSGIVESAAADTGIIESEAADTGIVESAAADTGIVESAAADRGISEELAVPEGTVPVEILASLETDNGPGITSLSEASPTLNNSVPAALRSDPIEVANLFSLIAGRQFEASILINMDSIGNTVLRAMNLPQGATLEKRDEGEYAFEWQPDSDNRGATALILQLLDEQSNIIASRRVRIEVTESGGG